jgi:cell division septation protein DedD
MSRLYILILLIAIVGCSTGSETEKDSEDPGSQEVYVFDDVTDTESEPVAEAPEAEATVQTPEPPPAPPPIQETVQEPEPEAVNTVDFHLVQVGAFTTEARARDFIKQNKDKIGYEMNVHYSEEVRLYVVQLQPFRTRQKAEEVRNELWNSGSFNDAFIVPK